MLQKKVGEQKSLKLFGRSSLLILLSAALLSAGTFDDFKRTQNESFQKYKDERDNEFNKYLKSQWQSYKEEQGIEVYEKPKPKKIKPAIVKNVQSVGPKVSLNVKEQPKVIPQPAKEILVQKESKKKKNDIRFDFFGSELVFNIPTNISSATFHPKNQMGITNFFNIAASSYYEDIIQDIKTVSKTLNLNDWGIYLLVLNISDRIYSSHDDSKLFSWFIFNKLGYAVKVGLSHKHVVLMHYSDKTIYSTPSYSFGKKKYYVMSNYAKGGVGKLFSYRQDYPNSTKALDLSLNSLPNFILNKKSKTLSFKESGEKYDIDFEFNQNLIDFMSTYPQADYETYFNAPIDSITYNSIAKIIKKYVDGKQISDAMNFVLHFVQNSFDYQMDNQQFGREKVMFAQETLYYNKSDCEDRAVLFAYLIKELFNIGVIGVKYEDHMATALYVPMDGDSVKSGTKKYVIADPTYINASIGQSMPKYKPKIPKSFIVVKKN